MRRLAPLSLCLLSFGCHVGSEAATDPPSDPDASDAPADDATDGSDGSDGSDGTTGEVADADGDGFDAEDDCDDDNPEAYPGAPIHDCDRCEAAAQLGGVDYATIQEAIDASEDGDTVQVCVGTHAEALLIDHDLVFESFSGDPADTILDGLGERRVLRIERASGPAPSATVRGLTFRNGRKGATGVAPGPFDGGALRALVSDLLIEDCAFERNWAFGEGGAISAHLRLGGEMVIARSSFTENSSAAQGGAVDVRSGALGRVLVRDSSFDGDRSGPLGSALAIRTERRGTVEVVGSEFSGDATSREGTGGLHVVGGSGSTVLLDGSSFRDHGHPLTTGATVLDLGTGSAAEIRNSTFSGNTSGPDGGAVALVGTGDVALSVEGSTFEDNLSMSSGGAIYASREEGGHVSMSLSDTTFARNRSWLLGGAIASTGAADHTVSISGGRFTNNHPAGGRCVVEVGHVDSVVSVLSLDSVTLESSTGSALCAGVHRARGDHSVEIVGSSFQGNTLGLDVRAEADVTVEATDFGTDDGDNTHDVRQDNEFFTGLGANESFTCTAGDCGL